MKLQTRSIPGFHHNQKLLHRWDQKACELLHNIRWRMGWLCWQMMHFPFVTYCCTWINKIHSNFWFCLVIWICICNETAFMWSQFTQDPVFRYFFRCEWHKFCCKQFSCVCNISLKNYWAVLINKGTHYELNNSVIMVFYCCKNYWSLHLHQFFGMIHPDDDYASTLSLVAYMTSCIRLWTCGTLYSFSYHKPKCNMTLIWSNPQNKTSPHKKYFIISYT